MLKLTHVRSTINGDIFVKQPWSTYYNLTHIQGDHITPNLVFRMTTDKWVDDVGLMQLRPISSLDDSLSVSTLGDRYIH